MTEQGYKVFELKGDAIFRLRNRLALLTKGLEKYNPSTSERVSLSKKFHAMKEWREILRDNLDELKSLVGKDILHQKAPYLRIARSNKPEDNIGIHRDTHYGASPNEWVLWCPITHAIHGAELRILPGSHLKSDDYYSYTQEVNNDVEKGSQKHWLGFRYAPKKMTPEVEAQTQPIPCTVGNAMLFNCALVHGQIINKAPWTRISIDIQLVDRAASFNNSRGLHGELYTPL